LRSCLILLLLTLPALAANREPSPIEIVQPTYSPEARSVELEGVAILGARIGVDGLAHDIQVHRPIGLGLDERAVEALMQWRFAPALRDGLPVERYVRIPITFSLPQRSSRWHLVQLILDPPEDGTAPRLLAASFPPGAGISPEAIEHASLVMAMGRAATVVISFDIGLDGAPANILVEESSDRIWEKEAVAVLQHWRFAPATVDGEPKETRAIVALAWGPKTLNERQIAAATGRHVDSVTSPGSVPGEYTEEAFRLGVEGEVKVAFRLGEDGKPAHLRVVQGLGHGLDEKALEAISRTSLRYNGQGLIPPGSEHTLGVRFRIHEVPVQARK
jgi:TonB family protein